MDVNLSNPVAGFVVGVGGLKGQALMDYFEYIYIPALLHVTIFQDDLYFVELIEFPDKTAIQLQQKH